MKMIMARRMINTLKNPGEIWEREVFTLERIVPEYQFPTFLNFIFYRFCYVLPLMNERGVEGNFHLTKVV